MDTQSNVQPSGSVPLDNVQPCGNVPLDESPRDTSCIIAKLKRFHDIILTQKKNFLYGPQDYDIDWSISSIILKKI